MATADTTASTTTPTNNKNDELESLPSNPGGITARPPRPVHLGRNSKMLRFDMEAEGMAYTDYDPRYSDKNSKNNTTTTNNKTATTGIKTDEDEDEDEDDQEVRNKELKNIRFAEKSTNVDSSLITPNTGNHITGSLTSSSRELHRRRTLYLIRHGEAVHNVLEKDAQQKAKAEAMKLGLSKEETWQMMEEARKAVLEDASLRDAPLTDHGREQARLAASTLEQLVAEGKAHPPTEAMCSPLTRCLDTCQILLQNYEVRAHVRQELQERQTLYPPDTPKPLEELIDSLRTKSLRSVSDDEKDDDDDDDNSKSSKSSSNDTTGHFILNADDWKTTPEDAEQEAQGRESKEMLRERASQLFDMLMEMEHRHILVVSHKGFLRELERGLLQIPEEESPLFGNCEMRVYRVIFTQGDRSLHHLERLV